ncbi:MAG TPA: glycosyltransferase family A protein [Bryobacteraceae bacterium]|jgi:glycosyltransferase involved in cell wall biosynthesis|nr:glycosyltransferase family A protein [Bryobacteraceae bacterium]
MPRLSVIIPVFNSAPYLALSVPALLRQEMPREEFELIFVDNNSTDGSAALLRQREGITTLEEPKQSAYAARNRGVEASRGDILVFTDPDCVPGRSWLRQIDGAFRDKAVQVMLGPRRFATDSLTLSTLADYETAKDAYMAGCRRMDVVYGFANNMAVRRAAFEEFGPFDLLARGGDTLFLRRVVAQYGYDALAFEETAAVRHMEIDSAARYFSKVVTYATSRKRNRGYNTAKPLSMRERFWAWQRAAAVNGYSPSRKAFSLALLGLGAALWKLSFLGSISAAGPASESSPEAAPYP